MNTRKRPAIFASLALLAFATALFFPALFQGKILAPLDITTTLLPPWNESAKGAKPHNHNPTDAVSQYLPYRLFAEKSLNEDGYIGWNPYEMGGYNLAANTMALPGTWSYQLHRFLPFKDAWNLGLFTEFLIAGFGMLVFLRSRKLGWIACLIGAAAFMANSQFSIWLYHRWALSSFCWMPWVLWSAVAWKGLGDYSPRRTLLPLFIAMALMGATLQHMVFVFLVCACIVLGGFRNIRDALGSWRIIGGWAIAWVLAVGISSFTLVPQIQAYLTNIGIGHVRGGIGYPNGYLEPLFSLLFIPAQIWPWLIGSPQTIDGFRMIKAAYMNVAYCGTIPMLLAFCSLFHKDVPKPAKWLIILGLFIPLTPLVGPLYHRVQLLFLLGAAWAAAEMVHTLASRPSPLIRRSITWIVVAFATALLIGALLPHEIRSMIENEVVSRALDARETSDPAWIAARAKSWTDRFSLFHPYTSWIFALWLCGCLGLRNLGCLKNRRTRYAAPLILIATVLELSTLFHSAATFSSPTALLPDHPDIERVRELAAGQRVTQRSPESDFLDMFATPNLLAAYRIPSIDAYESIQYPSPLTTLTDSSPSDQFSIAGVGIALHPVNTPAQPGTENWPILESLDGFHVRRNPNPLPLIAAGSTHPPHTPQEISASLATAQPVTPTSQTMNRCSITPPAAAKWLRFGQNWHQGWRWKTDHQPWTSFQQGSDSTCWILSLPANPSEIQIQFFPRPSPLSYFSLLVTAVSTALIFLSLFYPSRNSA